MDQLCGVADDLGRVTFDARIRKLYSSFSPAPTVFTRNYYPADAT